MRKEKRIPIYKTIWCKIRYWQMLHDISDEELSSMIGVVGRTIKEYDKDARHLTFEKLENFLLCTNLSLEQLLSL